MASISLRLNKKEKDNEMKLIIPKSGLLMGHFIQKKSFLIIILNLMTLTRKIVLR